MLHLRFFFFWIRSILLGEYVEDLRNENNRLKWQLDQADARAQASRKALEDELAKQVKEKVELEQQIKELQHRAWDSVKSASDIALCPRHDLKVARLLLAKAHGMLAFHLTQTKHPTMKEIQDFLKCE